MEDADKILENELGEVGGEFGGLGARWAARRMPNNAFGASIELEIGPIRALARFSEAADAVGRVIRHDGQGLTAVIAAGFLNMNPAVVDVKITPLGSHGCRVEVTGTAKEGLIKQRAGEGAVRRLLATTGFAAPPTSDIRER